MLRRRGRGGRRRGQVGRRLGFGVVGGRFLGGFQGGKRGIWWIRTWGWGGRRGVQRRNSGRRLRRKPFGRRVCRGFGRGPRRLPAGRRWRRTRRIRDRGA